MEDHGESPKEIKSLEKTSKQVDKDLDFLKSFRTRGGGGEEMGIKEIMSQNRGITREQAEMRFAAQQQEDRSKKEVANFGPSNVKKPETEFTFKNELMDRLKRLAAERERFNQAADAATEKGKLIEHPALTPLDTKNRPDLAKVASRYPKRYDGTFGEKDKKWRVAVQVENVDAAPDTREKLKINIGGQEKEIAVVNSLWMVDAKASKAVRYILADTGEWFVGSASSNRYDSKQHMEFWSFNDYKKGDDRDKKTVDQVLEHLNAA